MDKGKDKINDLLGGILGGDTNTTSKDSTTTKTDSIKKDPVNTIKEGVNSVLGGILGGKKNKKVQDSTKNK